MKTVFFIVLIALIGASVGAYLFLIPNARGYSKVELLRTIPIKEIVQDVRKFNGNDIRVSGTVTKSMGISMFKAFVLSSDGDEIIVLSNTAPRIGQEIQVCGEVDQIYKGSDKELIVIHESDNGCVDISK